MDIVEHEASPFSFSNKLGRIVWHVVYVFLFKYSPRPLHSWRSFLLKLFRAKVGKAVHIYPKATIWAPWNLEIDDNSCLADGVIVYNQAKIIVGKNVVVSQGTHLCSGTHDYARKSFPLIGKSIRIDDEVWIAAEAFVHPGIHIGEGSVIGARSVVTKDIPAWKIASGFPCIILKDRKFID